MSSPAPDSVEMVERVLGPRPSRVGVRRKGPRTPKASSRAVDARGGATCSLDTEKYLETSVRDLRARDAKEPAITCRAWAASERTEEEIRMEKWTLKRGLTSTVHAIWQEKVPSAGEAHHRWFDRLKEEEKLRPGETEEQRSSRVLKWKKANRLKGKDGDAWWWFRQYEQLRNCQAQWIGFRASCCKGATRPIAVPIGCKHRLCPMCCSQRASKSRERIRIMFDRLEHPVLITLTKPNQESLQRSDFKNFRRCTRRFLKQHQWTSSTNSTSGNVWIKGGLYSIETTFNRRDKSWHMHCHILADVVSPLPSKSDRTTVAGVQMFSFTAIKLALEFDWLRITSTKWGKKRRKDSDPRRKGGEIEVFEDWVRAGKAMRLREWRNGKMAQVDGLSESERAEREAWNRENRRVIDLRPVTDRDGAAKEVLKYLTKVSNFSDLPEAVEPFMKAVRSARLIQTFGTWYGAKLDPATEFNPEQMENDWSSLQCTCGRNHWERMGVFYRDDVEMDTSGRWHLKKQLQETCSGTVPRPSFRARTVVVEEF